jgi:hypothetical protein
MVQAFPALEGGTLNKFSVTEGRLDQQRLFC